MREKFEKEPGSLTHFSVYVIFISKESGEYQIFNRQIPLKIQGGELFMGGAVSILNGAQEIAANRIKDSLPGGKSSCDTESSDSGDGDDE